VSLHGSCHGALSHSPSPSAGETENLVTLQFKLPLILAPSPSSAGWLPVPAAEIHVQLLILSINPKTWNIFWRPKYRKILKIMKIEKFPLSSSSYPPSSFPLFSSTSFSYFSSLLSRFQPLFRVRSLAADTTTAFGLPAVLPRVAHCWPIAVLGSLLSSILYKWALQ
jgi:hypothetical protein